MLAVLRGTAVNNDGRSLSLMAPNALPSGRSSPRRTGTPGSTPRRSYVEAHGTGTALGDPVELAR